MAAPLHIILSKSQPLSKYKKGRNRTLICWFQANRIKPLMLLSYGMLVNPLHSLVKTKSWVKAPYIPHGQPLPTRIPRRLIPHHRRTRRISRPRSNSCISYLQLSPIPSCTYTNRKTILKHRRRTRSRTNLNHPPSNRPYSTRFTIPTNLIYNRRNR